MIDLPKNKHIVLFDGVCNLCDASVQFIIRHDKNDVFRYATLQRVTGTEIQRIHNIDTSKLDSIILYTPEMEVFYKSTAALKIAKKLKFPISILSVGLLLPRFIRDKIYNYIAKNRYQWYGKKEECMIPTPELKSKFLD